MTTIRQNSKENNIYYFQKIFLKYYTLLCIYAFRYVKDSNIVEDIVQDVFTSVWEKKSDIDFSLPIKPLLYKYTHNKALDYLKSSSFKIEKLEEYTGFEALDSYVRNLVTNQAEEDFNLKELNTEIQTCISRLPDRCKEVYNLSRINNMKNREIADKLGINIKTVEKHISKALYEIRQHLDKKGLLPILAFAVFYMKLQ